MAMDLTPPPSLDAHGFLALMQSFFLHHRRRKGFFSSMPMPEERFGAMRREDICTAEEWRAVLHDMTAMFLWEDPRKLPAIPNSGPDSEPDSGLKKGPANELEYGSGATLAECARTLWRAWSDGTRRVRFFTSGTTGTPRACIHSEAELKQESDCLRGLFSHTKAFLSSVPPHHLYGFTFGLYLPLVCGAPVRRTLPLSTLIMSQTRCDDAVIGVPVLWNAVARGNLKAAERHVSLVSASAPVRPETLDILEECGYRLIDVFGSSETGVMGIRGGSREPYELLPYFDRRKGVSDSLWRALPDGGARRCPLMDVLNWQGPRTFYPAGRRDRAVQVGGINVWPSRVANQLAEIPEVEQCAVRLADRTEGSRLKAFIVLKEGTDEHDFRQKLKGILRNFSPEERPVRVEFGRELPRNDMGKPQDW